MLIYAFLVIAALICAARAIRAEHLLPAAIWLAGVSALIATIMYRLGAEQVAVVELSVGAGLVTVLFVFAISIAGDEGLGEGEFMPNSLAIGVVALFVLLLGGMLLPLDSASPTITNDTTFSGVLWDDRALDVLVQLVLIFSGVLCLLGLLADVPEPPTDLTADFPRARITSTLDIVRPVPVEPVPDSDPSVKPTAEHTAEPAVAVPAGAADPEEVTA